MVGHSSLFSAWSYGPKRSSIFVLGWMGILFLRAESSGDWYTILFALRSSGWQNIMKQQQEQTITIRKMGTQTQTVQQYSPLQGPGGRLFGTFPPLSTWNTNRQRRKMQIQALAILLSKTSEVCEHFQPTHRPDCRREVWLALSQLSCMQLSCSSALRQQQLTSLQSLN